MRTVLVLGLALLGQPKDDQNQMPAIAADSASSPLGLRLSIELDELDLEILKQHRTVLLKQASLKITQKLNSRKVVGNAALEEEVAEVRYEEAKEAERSSYRKIRAYECDLRFRTVTSDDVKHYTLELEWLKKKEMMFQAEVDYRALPLERDRMLRMRGVFDPWKTSELRLEFDNARTGLVRIEALRPVVALELAARSGQKAYDPEEKHRLDAIYHQACVQSEETITADLKDRLDISRKLFNQGLILETEVLQIQWLYDNSRTALTLHRQRLDELKTLGERHPDFIKSLHDLAVALMAQGDYARAKPLFERLALRKSTLGESGGTYV